MADNFTMPGGQMHPRGAGSKNVFNQQKEFSSFQQKQQQQLENLKRYQKQQEDFQKRLEQMRQETIQNMQSEYLRAGAASLAAASGGAPQTGMGAKLAVGQQAAMTTAQRGQADKISVEGRFIGMQQEARDRAMQSQQKMLEFGAKMDQEKTKKLQDYRNSVQSIIDNSKGFFGANEDDVAAQVRRIAADEPDPAVKAELNKWAADISAGKWNLGGSLSRFWG